LFKEGSNGNIFIFFAKQSHLVHAHGEAGKGGEGGEVKMRGGGCEMKIGGRGR
jgi:hypothetical protein